jgi:hypothetical protein
MNINDNTTYWIAKKSFRLEKEVVCDREVSELLNS